MVNSRSQSSLSPLAITPRLGLLQQCKLVVGLPFLSSAGNLAFWLQLCGTQGAPWAKDALFKWTQAEAAGAEAFLVSTCGSVVPLEHAPQAAPLSMPPLPPKGG